VKARKDKVSGEAGNPAVAGAADAPQGAGQQGRPRLAKAEKEIATLKRRMAAVEQELQEVRHLNKRLAEITDVVAEVLLPAEERDEQRLRDLLTRYDAGL
jgi:hypothetical protein